MIFDRSDTLARLKETAWSGLVDPARLDHQEVLSVLRRLAQQSVAFVFADDLAPEITKADAEVLRPLFAERPWLEGRPAKNLRFLQSILYFTGKDNDFSDNKMVLAVGATSRHVGFFQRFGVRRKVQKSGLLGGDALSEAFLWTAWSDPQLQLYFHRSVRENWRGRTLFHPYEPTLPDQLSHTLLLAVVCLALSQDPAKHTWRDWRHWEIWRWNKLRRSRFVKKRLLQDLPEALGAMSQEDDFEQLIAIDALHRLGRGAEASQRFDAFCHESALGPIYGWGSVDETLICHGEGKLVGDEETRVVEFAKRLAQRAI